jgi:putative N6-adenine-specific DNA methylase
MLHKDDPPDRVRGEIPSEGLVPCRAGLEDLVAEEIRSLGVTVERVGRRAVFFQSNQAGIYRMNMALRTGLNVLIPIRTFNARNYDMLYYQSRKTNWHKIFSVDKSIRIDVNGGSNTLNHSEYVVHRVKDGIVDTFRKLCNGIRPSINKRNPDVHVVVHLDETEVTLALDTSGTPLFKRGYRTRHGGAPLKEDLAAAILMLSEWNGHQPLLDPMCGSGTFLFEAWMIATRRAPNLDRSFAFQSHFDYDPVLHEAEREELRKAEIPPPTNLRLSGYERDAETQQIAREILMEHFPEAAIHIENRDFREPAPRTGGHFIVTNPPYGHRLGSPTQAEELHRELGEFLKKRCPGSTAAVFSANRTALKSLEIQPDKVWTLFNGALEGRLLRFTV